MQNIHNACILIVDDNAQLLSLLQEELSRGGYGHLLCADSVAAARKALASQQPDLVILDINLPDGDGFSLFQEIRQERDVPILFLSARDADSDRLFGLGLGADDYMTKPFLMQELLLRVSGILRRSYREERKQDALVQLGTHLVNLGDASVTGPDGACALTATEHRLLQKLLDNRGRIVTYDALCEAVWGSDYYGCENSLNVHIRHLREKIEDDPSRPQWLLTVRGLGYKLAKEVQP